MIICATCLRPVPRARSALCAKASGAVEQPCLKLSAQIIRLQRFTNDTTCCFSFNCAFVWIVGYYRMSPVNQDSELSGHVEVQGKPSWLLESLKVLYQGKRDNSNSEMGSSTLCSLSVANAESLQHRHCPRPESVQQQRSWL